MSAASVQAAGAGRIDDVATRLTLGSARASVGGGDDPVWGGQGHASFFGGINWDGSHPGHREDNHGPSIAVDPRVGVGAQVAWSVVRVRAEVSGLLAPAAVPGGFGVAGSIGAGATAGLHLGHFELYAAGDTAAGGWVEHLAFVSGAHQDRETAAAGLGMAVQLGPVSVRHFFERLVRLVADDCAARATTIEVAEGAAATIVADSRVLHQTMVLLLTNALDAMESSRERRIVLGCDVDARSVRVWISDTGPGMTRDQIANAQRPFVTTKVKGTGLGLPIAHRYAHLMKCRLELASVVGEGTRCTLEFEQINSSES